MSTPNARDAAPGTRAAAPRSQHEHYETDEELVTGEAVALDLRPASFILRAAGAMIDILTLALIAFGAVYLVSESAGGLDPAAMQALTIVLVVTVTIVVPTAIETLSHGRSLGKLAVGARIVRDDGGSIGFRHAFIRALTGVLELFLTFGGLAALVALLNSRSKRLGDLLAGTYSQNERVAEIVEPVFIVPPRLEQWSRTADVGRLPDRLSRRISQFLTQAGALLPDARARVGAELAAEAAPYVSPVPAAHPEELLIAVVAIRRARESTALGLEKARMLQLDAVLGGRPHGFPERG